MITEAAQTGWIEQYVGDELAECMRALDWSYYWGLAGDEANRYWTEAEPLDHYRWVSFERAVLDAETMLAELPEEYYGWDPEAVFDGEYEIDYPFDDETDYNPNLNWWSDISDDPPDFTFRRSEAVLEVWKYAHEIVNC